MFNNEINYVVIKYAILQPRGNFRDQNELVALKGKMVISHSRVVNINSAYYKSWWHVIIILDMIHYRFIDNRVEKSF